MKKHLRFLMFLLYTVVILAALAVLLPGLLPFLLAWGLASLLELPVRFLCDRVHLRRSWSAAVVLLLLVLALAGILALLMQRLWFEFSLLSQWFPAILEAIQDLQRWTEGLIYRLTTAVTPSFRTAINKVLSTAASRLGDYVSDLSARLLSKTVSAVAALPAAGLFLFTTLLASYFILAGRPTLSAWVRQHFPQRWLLKLENTSAKLKGALGGWLRAQGILIGVTFLLLSMGFLWMDVEPAILLAALVAALDALPVFGTGTVLIPWALTQALSGRLLRCGALLALYALIWLTRSLLEPRLIARRAGLHPLWALMSMYLGFTLFGVAGILLAPLAAVVVRQLYDSGFFSLRK